MARPSALPLPVRNRLATLILDTLAGDEAAWRTLRALVRYCRAEVAPGESVAPLLALGWFRRGDDGRPVLLAAHRPYYAALADRVARAEALLDEPGDSPGGDPLTGLLGQAARLAGRRLFFEVHELLEPSWMRAEGDRRVALQGLIQVAVAFHHLEQDNRPGAVSLLTEGLGRLDRAAASLPLSTAAWRAALAGVLADLTAGRSVVSLPPWPSPADPADPGA